MGFGHGSQACAGRFFASYMLKIILSHVLMKYDFSVLVPEEGPSFDRAYNTVANPNLQVNLRRRTEEIMLCANKI